MHERDTLLWCIPLVYITSDNLNASVPRGQVVWMKEERYISINNLPGHDSFVIVNPNEIGEVPAYSRLRNTLGNATAFSETAFPQLMILCF
jgi:hypothetical protein